MRAIRSPYLFLGLAVLFWAGNVVLGRAMHGDIPPTAFNFWRWLVAGVVLTPFAGPMLFRHWAIVVRDWPVLVVLAFLGVAAYNTLAYTALSKTASFNAAVMMSAVPVVIPLIDFVLNRARITRGQGVGIAVSLAGVLIILFQGDPSRVLSFQFGTGEAWMIGAVASWASYSVMLRRRPDALPPLAMLLAIIWAGVALLLPVFAWEASVHGMVTPTLETVSTLGYVGVFASILSYLFWNRGVAAVGPARAGLFSHLLPVFSAGLAFVFLGETLGTYHFVGMALILMGIYASSRSRDV